MKRKVEELAKEEIIIRIPKRFSKQRFPSSLSVVTLVSWLVYGRTDGPPPTKGICRAADYKNSIRDNYGSPTKVRYKRKIIIQSGEMEHAIYLKGKPDLVNWNTELITELRTYSTSRDKAIEVAKNRLELYLGLLGFSKGKGEIRLFHIPPLEKGDNTNSISVIPVEFYNDIVVFHSDTFKRILRKALKVYFKKRPKDVAIAKVHKEFEEESKKWKYF